MNGNKKVLPLYLSVVMILFFCFACSEKESLLVVTDKGEKANKDSPLNGIVTPEIEKLWETRQAGENLLASVQNIAFTEEGGLAVLDRKKFLVHLFKPDGEFLLSFGKRGEGPGEIKHLGHGDQLFIAGGKIRISDMGKIHEYSLEGEFVRDIPYPAHLTPRGFPNADQFVAGPVIADSRDQKLQVYSLLKKTRETIQNYSEYDAAKGKRKKSRAIVAGGITPMMRVAARDNMICYGLNSIYRVHRIDLSTSTVTSFSIPGREQRPVRQSFIDYLNDLWKDYPKDKVIRYFDALPDLECHFQGIYLNGEGLVFLSMVNLDEDNHCQFDVFDLQGKYLYRVNISLEQGIKIRQTDIRGGRIAFSVLDQNDEPRVMVYRLPLTIRSRSSEPY